MTDILALPEIFLAATGLALLLVGAFARGDATRRVAALSVFSLVIAMMGVAALAPDAPATAFGGLFIVDGFSRYLKVLVLGASALAIIMSLDYIEREDMKRFEFPILIQFATLGMLMMLSANNLIALYLGLELQSLALYVVAAFQRDSLRSTEAGLKYFVLGALSSGMLLYGASLVYGFTGTTSFEGLATAFADPATGSPSIGLIFGIVFIVAGLAFKVSAVPFHMWTPDVYEGAPTPITAFFAAAPKIAAFGLFVRVMIGPFGDLVAQWQQIIVFISIASMILGSFAAINQSNIKRLMAYSSIGHIGYTLVGLAPGTEIGVRAVLVYLAIYVVMNIGTFACILLMRRKGRMVEGVADLAGLSKTNPMMALALAIFMFSMAGIPPLGGFLAKFFVFQAAIQSELYTLAVIGVVTSVIAAYYYVRIVKLMYFDDAVESFDRPRGWAMNGIIGATGLVTLLFLLGMNPVLGTARAAAAALFAG